MVNIYFIPFHPHANRLFDQRTFGTLPAPIYRSIAVSLYNPSQAIRLLLQFLILARVRQPLLPVALLLPTPYSNPAKRCI